MQGRGARVSPLNERCARQTARVPTKGQQEPNFSGLVIDTILHGLPKPDIDLDQLILPRHGRKNRCGRDTWIKSIAIHTF